jgi:CRISPR/Cas system-associated exonuclease Cas4 (RecB family)
MNIYAALENAQLYFEAVSRGEYCCLRHGLPYITPSLLAEQAFCEMRLHLRLTQGDIPDKVSTSSARELLKIMLNVKNKVPKLMELREFFLSIPLAAIVNDVPILGRPPAIHVKDGCADKIYIVKTSSSLRIYRSDIVKGLAYSLIIYKTGLSCKDLGITYVVTREPKHIVKAIRVVKGDELVSSNDIRVVKKVFDYYEAMNTLSPLLAYWLGMRDPYPIKTSYCKRCTYKNLCTIYQLL